MPIDQLAAVEGDHEALEGSLGEGQFMCCCPHPAAPFFRLKVLRAFSERQDLRRRGGNDDDWRALPCSSLARVGEGEDYLLICEAR